MKDSTLAHRKLAIMSVERRMANGLKKTTIENVRLIIKWVKRMGLQHAISTGRSKSSYTNMLMIFLNKKLTITQTAQFSTGKSMALMERYPMSTITMKMGRLKSKDITEMVCDLEKMDRSFRRWWMEGNYL